MSSTNDDTAPQAPTEKQILMDRAKLMGIKFSNNISVESLREKINGVLANDETLTDIDEDADQDGDGDQNDTTDNDQDNEQTEQTPAAMTPPASANTKLSKAERQMLERKEQRDDALKLIRLRITNMDPKKADLHGEILSVGNEVVGTVRKFIPYGEATDNGYHVPNILYKALKRRRFLSLRLIKDKRTGTQRPEMKWMREFSLEVLPQLTKEELHDLKISQMAAGSIDND
jgi:hypothetical protein